MSEARSEETIRDRRHRLSSIPKACEGCRIRKVRCDRSHPCSNCQTAGIVCQQTEARVDSRSKTDRVARLEDLVGRLDERLGQIERQLKEQSRPSPERFTVDSCPTPLYEGGSSFSNQSAQATEVAQRTALARGTEEGESLTASFDDLKSLLQPSSTLEDFQFSQSPAFRSSHATLPLPSELVVAIMRSWKVNPPLFLLSFPMNDLEWVEDLFRKVYFPIEPVSVGHVTAVHGILLSVLKEFIGLKHPLMDKYDLKAYLKACELSFNAGIENYEILVVPSFETILALVLGVIKAQDEARPLLSSTLIFSAARHCLMLGYNRAATYLNQRADVASKMSRLFWTVYMFDKNMSLLMGRTSCIQDHDIDIPYPNPSDKPDVRPWDEAFIMYLRLAQLQGQIYDRVYSAAALRSTPEDRAQNIRNLTDELERWHAKIHQIDFSTVAIPQLVQLSIPAWDIAYYSVVTSLLRGSSTSTTAPEITSQCFKTARVALESHLRCFPLYRESTIVSVRDYANWVMLFSSFTPFIVIFLHAIAATSTEDVQLLEDVVRTLQPIRGTSKASARLYQICTIFARVARKLVESRNWNSFLGTYNERDDSLQLQLQLLNDNDTGLSLFDPESLQDYFSADMVLDTQFTHSEASGMSAILGNWVSGQPPTVDMWRMNFGMSNFGEG